MQADPFFGFVGFLLGLPFNWFVSYYVSFNSFKGRRMESHRPINAIIFGPWPWLRAPRRKRSNTTCWWLDLHINTSSNQWVQSREQSYSHVHWPTGGSKRQNPDTLFGVTPTLLFGSFSKGISGLVGNTRVSTHSQTGDEPLPRTAKVRRKGARGSPPRRGSLAKKAMTHREKQQNNALFIGGSHVVVLSLQKSLLLC